MNTHCITVIDDYRMVFVKLQSTFMRFRNNNLDSALLGLRIRQAREHRGMSQEDLAAALRAGARGYLLKNMEPNDVEDAILRAARGETVVAPEMTGKLVNLLDQKQGTPDSLLTLLTQREQEVLSYLSRGQSNKAIARALNISHDTVKLHVRHILAKLNLTSRVEAAVFAVEHKFATRS